MLIINAIVLNILSGAMLFALARMYERRIFIPAENDAQRPKSTSSSTAKLWLLPGRDLYSAHCRRDQYSQ